MIKKLLLIVLIAFFSIDTNGQINEFTKNMQLHEGLFNYYWDNKTGKIYLQINQLTEEILYINYWFCWMTMLSSWKPGPKRN